MLPLKMVVEDQAGGLVDLVEQIFLIFLKISLETLEVVAEEVPEVEAPIIGVQI